MTYTLDVHCIKHVWNELELCYKGNMSYLSSSFIMSRCAEFQVKFANVEQSLRGVPSKSYCMFIKFCNLRNHDQLLYVIKLRSKVLAINKTFRSDEKYWRIVAEDIGTFTSIDLHVKMDLAQNSGILAKFHEESLMTDIELRAEDGSIQAHKAIVGASSDVLYRILSGNFHDNLEGSIDVEYASKETLQHLKDYIYLSVLPSTRTSLLQLLLFATCYMMSDLEQRCLYKLLGTVTSNNVTEMIDYAAKHKLPKLTTALLEHVQSGDINVTPVIHKHE